MTSSVVKDSCKASSFLPGNHYNIHVIHEASMSPFSDIKVVYSVTRVNLVSTERTNKEFDLHSTDPESGNFK